MRTQSRDTHPEAERVLIELIRKASVAKRFELVRSMTMFAARLNLKNLQEQQPHADKEAIATCFIANHSNENLAGQLRIALQECSTGLTIDLLEAILPLSAIFAKMQIPDCVYL